MQGAVVCSCGSGMVLLATMLPALVVLLVVLLLLRIHAAAHAIVNVGQIIYR